MLLGLWAETHCELLLPSRVPLAGAKRLQPAIYVQTLLLPLPLTPLNEA